MPCELIAHSHCTANCATSLRIAYEAFVQQGRFGFAHEGFVEQGRFGFAHEGFVEQGRFDLHMKVSWSKVGLDLHMKVSWSKVGLDLKIKTSWSKVAEASLDKSKQGSRTTGTEHAHPDDRARINSKESA